FKPTQGDPVSQIFSPESIQKHLLHLKSSSKTLRRIPKSARFLAADKLARVIENCLVSKSPAAFKNLLIFAHAAFDITSKSKDISLTKKIKNNLNSLSLSFAAAPPSPPPPSRHHNKPVSTPRVLKSVVEAKVSDFDIRGAVKLLSSDDTVAPFNQATYEALKLKHPTPSRSLHFPDPPDDTCIPMVVREAEVAKAINSFLPGSSPGIDGMRPQYLKDVTSKSAGEAGCRALSAITNLCNFLLSGNLPDDLCPLLYGASLCALKKKDGGLRPIAVGNTFRRLTSKLVCFKLRPTLNEYLLPHQLGVSAKQGCEAAIHSVRTYVSNPSNSGKVLLKIDFKNAFNSVERDVILHQVKAKIPSAFPFLNQCYRKPSCLFFGKEYISSVVGAQQGDPCGPLAFCLAVQHIVQSMKSELNVWYLDDATLADDPETVLSDFKALISLAKDAGLEINSAKCEIFSISSPLDISTLNDFRSIAPDITLLSDRDLSLLGAPILLDSFEPYVAQKVAAVQNLFDRASILNSHVAYTLIKHCFY
ncbi:uncharacterized protein LOC103522716, partial [Diaphorina citri]|uniref:Uncharacterized protein LOC103522716 n=1 Tax=Diaphorina citri TaxID=121845 RepID=A0A1S3DQS3_DIACI